MEQIRLRLFACLALLCFAVAPASLFAQFEIMPYAGYVWPGSLSGGIGEFKGSQTFGVRGGGYIGDNFELGANYYWNQHFQPRRSNSAASLAGDLGFPQGAVRGQVAEAEFTYNLKEEHKLLGYSIRPYFVAGAGALVTTIKHEDTFVLNVRSVPTPSGTVFVANDVLDDNDAFFTVSYGAGLKANRLWGPLGFFGDFRGRTVPNFFGHANTWPEISAGLTFTWGE